MQTARLIASDAGFDWYGYSVASDGTSIAVGSPLPNNQAGAVYAYLGSNNDSTWTGQEVAVSDGLGEVSPRLFGDHFGSAVAIDGNTLLVGSPDASQDPSYFNGYGDGKGAAYVFTSTNGTWTQTQKLISAMASVDEAYSETVSLGTGLAVIGGAGHDVNGVINVGAAYVYNTTGSAFTLESVLEPSDPGSNYQFGRSVSTDGTTVFVGSWENSVLGQPAGTAYAFENSFMDASAQTFSPDGQYLYVAGAGANAVSVLQRNASTGLLTVVQTVANGTVLNGTALSGLDGASNIVVSPDGTQVAVAGENADDVVIFTRDPSTGLLTSAMVLTSSHFLGSKGFAFAAAGPGSTIATNFYVTNAQGEQVVVFSLSNRRGPSRRSSPPTRSMRCWGRRAPSC